MISVSYWFCITDTQNSDFNNKILYVNISSKYFYRDKNSFQETNDYTQKNN